jgi:hypothetical protein
MPAHLAALELFFQDKVDIIQVQEPWTTYPTRTQTHPGWKTYAPVDSWASEEERPRVMTYVRIGAELTVQQHRPTGEGDPLRDLLWLNINGISLLNAYRAPDSAPVIDYVTSLDELPEKLVVGGDFNAIHSSWQPGAPSLHAGARLAKWADDTGLLYTGEPGVPDTTAPLLTVGLRRRPRPAQVGRFSGGHHRAPTGRPRAGH